MPHVWLAAPHEAETVAALLVAFRNWWGSDWPSDNAVLASVERLIVTPDCDYFLAAADEHSEPRGVAQVRYRWSVWMAAEDCWLEDLYVLDDTRGTGLGKALAEAIYERARERGCRRIELDVEDDNEPALNLYRSQGYETGKWAATTLMYRRRIWENLPEEAPYKKPT